MLTVIACESEISEEEINTISTAYTEILIAESRYHSDSLQQKKVIDSLLATNNFESRDAFNNRMRELAEHPDMLRKVLDSAQFKLERARTDTIHSTNQ